MPDLRPEPRPASAYPVLLDTPTRWSDNDLFGHLNNAVYYELFDSAINRHLAEAFRGPRQRQCLAHEEIVAQARSTQVGPGIHRQQFDRAVAHSHSMVAGGLELTS